MKRFDCEYGVLPHSVTADKYRQHEAKGVNQSPFQCKAKAFAVRCIGKHRDRGH